MLISECGELYSEYFPFWDKLTDSQKEAMCLGTVNTDYDKGTNIHGNKNECTGAILIKSGCIRVYMLSEEGKEITLYRLYPGDFCVLSASCVLESITFDVYMDAEEKSNIFIISPNALSSIMEENIYARNFALDIATKRFSEVMWAMQQILFMSFDKRLAVFLIDEVSKNGKDKIELTHEQIAKYMGSAREVVTRMLKYFVDEGLVELKRGEIKIIDKTRLKKLAFNL